MPDQKADRTSAIGHFFRLQPIFTPKGLRVLWWLYLAYEALTIWPWVHSAIYSSPASLDGTVFWVLHSILPIYIILLRIAFVRLLLEIAIIFLARHSERFRTTAESDGSDAA